MKITVSFKLVSCLVSVSVLCSSPVAGRIHGDVEFERFLRPSDGDDKVTSPAPAPAPGCFSGESTVQELAKGMVSMKDLQVGEKILTKSGKFLPVYAFGHHQMDTKGTFIQLHTSKTNRPLEVTGDHLVYLENKANPVRADSIHVGDRLLKTPEALESGRVFRITTVERKGLYAPLTIEGTLVVDGVVASSYISFQKDKGEIIELAGGVVTGLSHHDFVHLALSPFRMLCLGVSSSMCQQFDEETGMPHYVSQGIKLIVWGKQQPFPIQALALFFAMVLLGMCLVVEISFGPSIAPLVLLTLGALYGVGTRIGLSVQRVKTV